MKKIFFLALSAAISFSTNAQSPWDQQRQQQQQQMQANQNPQMQAPPPSMGNPFDVRWYTGLPALTQTPAPLIGLVFTNPVTNDVVTCPIRGDKISDNFRHPNDVLTVYVIMVQGNTQQVVALPCGVSGSRDWIGAFWKKEGVITKSDGMEQKKYLSPVKVSVIPSISRNGTVTYNAFF